MHNPPAYERIVTTRCEFQGWDSELESGKMDLSPLREAACDNTAVTGLTHNFYRYPARFSPVFAKAAICCLSKPGDLILDPYMGGGTAIVEALSNGRRAIGMDINSLSVFITRAKTTPLISDEGQIILTWFDELIEQLHYHQPIDEIADILKDRRTYNLTLPRARAIKKAIAIALVALDELPNNRCKGFARCVILRTAQWALDNRVSNWRKSLAG